MGANSSIEWTHHTFNPWIGCTHVSPGCVNCYAETLMDRRYGRVEWGKGKARMRTSVANWRKPLSWNKAAAAEGVRARVFCASLADVFDEEVGWEWRRDLFKVVERTPHLDWLLLTKRPQHVNQMVERATGRYSYAWLANYPNVWIGTSVEDQRRADERIPHLLNIPARVRFLSCEPLLGALDLDSYFWHQWEGSLGQRKPACFSLHWVIAGGESGPGARPMHPDWARILRDQCQAAGVAFHFKQWGEYAPAPWDNPKPVLAVCADGSSVVAQIGHVLGFRETDEVCMERIGKLRAGRLLDGRTWDEVPV